MKKIEIFGTGCPKCRRTEQNVRKAVQELGIEAEVTHVYDQLEMLKRGITNTPAVVIDGEVKIAGRVPEVDEIKELLST